MTSSKWGSLDYWKTRHESGDIGRRAALREGKLSPRTTFLWSRETNHLPPEAEARLWEWAPEPKAIAGYLHHIVLPKFFLAACDTGEGEKVQQPATIIEKAEDMLSRLSAACAGPGDVKFMIGLMDSLDSVLDKDDAQVTRALNLICARWNDRFASTQRMDHEIYVCASPEEAGLIALDRASERDATEWDDHEADDVQVYGYQKRKWLELCRQALLDEQKGIAFLTALMEEGTRS